MTTRNPNNQVLFNTVSFGASVSVYQIQCLAGAAEQTNPGEDLEAAVETIQLKATILGFGVLDEDLSNSTFNVYLEGSAWTPQALEDALTEIGGIFATTTVLDIGL
jgi:hypothetical protein